MQKVLVNCSESSSGLRELQTYFKSFGYAMKRFIEANREALLVALGTLRAVVSETETLGSYDLTLYQEGNFYKGSRQLSDSEIRESVVKFLRTRELPSGWEQVESVRVDRLQREFLGEPLSMDLSMGRWEVKRKLKELLEPLGLLDVAPEYDIVTVKKISDGQRIGSWDLEGEQVNVEGDLFDLYKFITYLQMSSKFKVRFKTDVDYRDR